MKSQSADETCGGGPSQNERDGTLWVLAKATICQNLQSTARADSARWTLPPSLPTDRGILVAKRCQRPNRRIGPAGIDAVLYIYDPGGASDPGFDPGAHFRGA